MDVAFFRAWIERAADAIAAEKNRLTALDAAIGDGDHGTNLNRGFTAVRAALAAKPPTAPGALLTQVGMTLISSVGGASGPLYGTVFRRIGKALTEAERAADPGTDAAADGEAGPDGAAAAVTVTVAVSLTELAAAFQAGLEGLTRLGGAGVGDKTMVDAFAPAVDALRAAADEGAPTPEALGLAADVAEAGARETIPWRARKGRASYLGERSEGHEDPGAASAALIWRALAQTAQ
jgi:dihydroxyacetone kinase-like protein